MVMAEADADTAATEFLHFPVFVVFVGDLQGNLQSRGTSASSSTGKLQVNLFKDLKVLRHLSRRNLVKNSPLASFCSGSHGQASMATDLS